MEDEFCSMNLNGYGEAKQHTGRDIHSNGTNDTTNSLSEMLDSDRPKCSLCMIAFNSFKDSELHFSSLEHLQKVLEQNLVSFTSNTYKTLTSPMKNQTERMYVDKIEEKEQQEESPSSSQTNNLENERIKLAGLSYLCSLCNKKCNGRKPYIQHLESRSHIKKDLLKRNAFGEIKPVDCHMFYSKELTGEKPCKEQLMMEQSSHINTDEDSVTAAKKIKIEFLSGANNQNYCKICDLVFNGSIPYFQHLAGKVHKKNEAKYLAQANIKSPNNQLNLPLDNNIDVDHVGNAAKNTYEDSVPAAKKIKIEFLSGENNQNYCEICDLVCSGSIPYSQHLAGKVHKKNEAKSVPKVNIQPSFNQHDPFLPNISKIDHLNTADKNDLIATCSENISDVCPTVEQNKMEIGESKPTWFCTVCNVQSTGPTDFSHHTDGKKHNKKLLFLQKENNLNEPKDSIDFTGIKTNANTFTVESSCCSPKQNMDCENENNDLKKEMNVKIFSLDEKINFD